ncbi:class I SAM-dependent methyltransferase [Actinocrinis puniceicyclus]|uniref:Class I SAM-dependent methyltransferase n=1 Tax=Actinocrinis puniceicyclus TaxID=977794 RepID=A0A8J7WM69_9ACTN|nr:class I SAM-dependent methyltransferase [Actinocrinis puniceicyclus]MBS2964961.1 class I SAM-dependent methyltransferase [Actinocrinis puniceicyclus]
MTATESASALPEQCTTRPGTPMIGPYSTNQMDDFYHALHRGEAKPTGIMNLLQHLLIAERCPEGATVLDVCCGRGLALPLLHRYAPHILRYVGLDISDENVSEAHDMLARCRAAYGDTFAVEFVHCDVSEPFTVAQADVAIYTSALEHLPGPLGAASLRHTADALGPGGVLYLSTPATEGDPPRPLQHRVHVYEWSRQETIDALESLGLVVEQEIGLLPPGQPVTLATELAERYGHGAATWYYDLVERVPAALLGTITAACAPRVATEILYVARKPL